MNKIMGKLVAGLIGFFTLGIVGLLFGIAIGHAFDRGLWQALQAASPDNLARSQKQFFDTTFTLLGYVAKSDGRVSEAEIAQAEALFRQLRLNPTQRNAAIQHFREGAEPGFDPAATVTAFAGRVGQRRQVQQTLFAFLASMALADGELAQPERAALHHIASLLGMPTQTVDRLVAMLVAQSRFHTGGGGGQSMGTPAPRDRLNDAYQALGVSASDSNDVIKKSYRRLMSENHPDKLIAKGVPDEMVKLGTERSQEISTAYEVIKTARGMK
ncbi:MAG: co-chaperone DjlA [Luminiphilus sp.]|nr:co-chaperone DjlA [Luminiphilus sp.]MDG1460067.1 co-chaperone DjlA [Luminiphilus sp.]